MSSFSPEIPLWQTVKAELRKILPSDEFLNWFDRITCAKIENDCLHLLATSDMAEIWVNNNYHDLLKRHINLAAGRPMAFKLSAPEMTPPVPSPELAAPQEKTNPPPRPAQKIGPAINSEYTFENFVVGTENQYAHAAALNVANEPGYSNNPLFIYGATGLGKTHLAQAIANAVFKRKPDTRIAYISSETFVNEFVSAKLTNSYSEVRNRYRNVDILIVDDIHFIAGKEATQEEFFHTFNALYNDRRQIVLTSDRPVSEIQKLESRLVSRFMQGMTVDIQPPQLETRMAILMKKANTRGVILEPDVVDFLATHITRNVRNLEGAITRISGYLQLNKNVTKLKISDVERILHDVLLQEVASQLNAEIIQKRVADYYRMNIADMTSKKRTAAIAFPRQIAMYLCTQLTDMALTSIGGAFGGRNHGTVIHASKAVKTQMEIDPNVKRTVDFLTVQISTRAG